MLPRHLTGALQAATAASPVVTLTGPRQSGKTTLVRATFPDHRYPSLEAPDERAGALAWWTALPGNPNRGGVLVHGGSERFESRGFLVLPWLLQ